MTTRRSRGSRGRSRGRTGRNVWVNENINEIVVINGIQIRDILGSAEQFMTFDTTVQEVIVTDLHYSFVSVAPAGVRNFRCALIVGSKLLDAADFQVLFADSLGPAWMGVWGNHVSVTGVDVQNLPLTPREGLRFHSKRRFRENNDTVWFVFQNVAPATDTTPLLSGMFRTLIHIP